MNMQRRSSHKNYPTLFKRSPGQAIVLIALVMVALLGFTALAIDGGQLYFLQRDAQNAADAAIVAALFELCKDPSVPLDDPVRLQDARDAGQAAALKNGFDDAADNVTVTVTVPFNSSYSDVEVIITASKPAQLVQVVYQGPLEIRARTEGHCESGRPFSSVGFAMFGGGSCTNPNAVNFQGSSHNSDIIGGISGNGDVAVSGGGTGVDSGSSTGTVSTGGGATVGSTTNGAANTPMPVIWEIDEFRYPGGLYAEAAYDDGKYHYYSGDLRNTALPTNADGEVLPGIYFVEGDIDLRSNDFGDVGAVGVTFVTPHTYSSGAVNIPFSPYDPDDIPPLPLIFAEGGGIEDCSRVDIGMSGSGVFWVGVLYAPNGVINLSGSVSGTMNGCMIGYRVSVSASEFDITCSPLMFPPIKPAVNISS